MAIYLTAALVTCLLGLMYVIGTGWGVRRRALRRISWHEEEIATPGAAFAAQADDEGWLTRWLMLAGFRDSRAPGLFLLATSAGIAVGLLLGQIYRSFLLGALVDLVSNAPGGTAQIFVAILQSGTWTLFFLGASIPTLVVRAARRRRLRETQRDLPLALELFATMAEAGLGFDAALARIVRSQGRDRPLSLDFQEFQRDVLAGVPRVQALRMLARRADVPALTTFVSAIIQAEQMGASMADTLRHQAEDLRNRRREQALLLSQALPVRLVFPLVACFLPGIFVSTLAPVIYQMLQVAGGIARSAGR
jgi:tight adherence protein C